MFAVQLLIVQLLIALRKIGEVNTHVGIGRESKTSRLQGVQEGGLLKVAITESASASAS
jgi:hypothetical protein